MQRYKSNLAEENRQKISGQLEEALTRLKKVQKEDKIIKDVNQKIDEEKRRLSWEHEKKEDKHTLFSLLVMNKDGLINPVTFPAMIGLITMVMLPWKPSSLLGNLFMWILISWLFGFGICFTFVHVSFGKLFSKIMDNKKEKRYHQEVEIPINNFKSKYPILFDNSRDSREKIISDFRRILPYDLSAYQLDECLESMYKSFSKYKVTSLEKAHEDWTRGQLIVAGYSPYTFERYDGVSDEYKDQYNQNTLEKEKIHTNTYDNFKNNDNFSSHETDAEESIDPNSAEERLKRWEAEQARQQKEFAEAVAQSARKFGESRDKVNYYDDLLGRSAEERKLEDRQWDYHKDKDKIRDPIG